MNRVEPEDSQKDDVDEWLGDGDKEKKETENGGKGRGRENKGGGCGGSGGICNGCCDVNNITESIIIFICQVIYFLFFPIFVCFSIKIARDFERIIIFRLGKCYDEAHGPGIVMTNPLLDEYKTIDLRTVTFDVPPQEVLTRDSVTVSVDAVVYFRVYEPTFSLVNVVDPHTATRLLSQTTLRNMLGTLTLAEILSNRESISLQMQEQLDEATDSWGIKVERVDIKDVVLPKQLQRAMAAEAEAAREAKAQVIAAEGEHKAAKSLQAAADIIGGSPQALHLRYLQTLNQISSERTSTVVFPFPVEMMKKYTEG